MASAVDRNRGARKDVLDCDRDEVVRQLIRACQVACPSEAIIFGDLNDPESEVSKYRDHVLGYKVLKELNTRPNVTYIAKLKNTHTEDK